MDAVTQFRAYLLKILYPVLVRAGKIHAPFSHKQVKSHHYRELRPLLRPGIVFVTRTEGELTNYLIPGYWSHVGVFANDDHHVIEAIGEGVVETDLIDFLLTKDHVVALRPQFCSEKEMSSAAAWAMLQKGKPYDYQLQDSQEAFYCAEIAWAAYNAAMLGKSPFVARKIMGVATVSPDDFLKASDKWEVIWDSRKTSVLTEKKAA